MIKNVILGCDPGVKNLAVVLYDIAEDTFIEHYSTELLKCENLKKSAQIYLTVFNKFKDYVFSILSNYNIEVIALEKPFFTFKSLPNNIKTLEIIALIKLVADLYKIPVEEYSPNHIKKVITGNGKAEKEDIIKAINPKHLHPVNSTHIADASAVALTSFYFKSK